MPGNLARTSQTLKNERPLQRHPRILFSIPITLQYLGSGGVRSGHGISLDISEGGMGALVDRVLQVGDMVGLDLELPERQLSTIAIVRYSSSSRSGFEFVGLTVEERARLAGIVARA